MLFFFLTLSFWLYIKFLSVLALLGFMLSCIFAYSYPSLCYPSASAAKCPIREPNTMHVVVVMVRQVYMSLGSYFYLGLLIHA